MALRTSIQQTSITTCTQLHRMPARPFADPGVEAVLLDVLDGFFPAPLKNEFPDGVPIKVGEVQAGCFGEGVRGVGGGAEWLNTPSVLRACAPQSWAWGNSRPESIRSMQAVNVSPPLHLTFQVVDKTRESWQSALAPVNHPALRAGGGGAGGNVRTWADLEAADAEPLSRDKFLSKLPQSVIR